MGKGQAFLNVPDITSRGEICHLNVIITNPDDENNVLVVPVYTYREKDGKPFPGQDLSCLIPAGCHPFIKGKSYIRYHNAMSLNLITIFNGLNNGKIIRQADFNEKLVYSLQRGAESSPYLPEKFKKFFRYF